MFVFINHAIDKELLEPEPRAFLPSLFKFYIYGNTSFLRQIKSVSGVLIQEQALLGNGRINTWSLCRDREGLVLKHSIRSHGVFLFVIVIVYVADNAGIV